MDTANCQENGILLETIDHLKAALGDQLETLVLERIVIGIFFIGVKLSNGQGGLCFTPIKMIPEAVCCPSSAKAMPNSGKLRGTKVLSLLATMFSGNVLKRAIGIAVINALSNMLFGQGAQPGYAIFHERDPLDGYMLRKNGKAVVVGALVPYIRMLISTKSDFSILEKDTKTLKPDALEHYVPQEMAAQKIAEADLVIITGTTLINGTLEGLLALARPQADVFVVGPTASMLPEAFFARGVTALGGVMVTDPDPLLDVLAEAGSGYHFFGKSADRVVIARSRPR